MLSFNLKNAFSKKVAESIPVLNENSLMMPFPEGCTHCGACIDNCPSKAIDIIDDRWTIDLGRCVFCLECTEICPEHLLTKIPALDYALTRDEMVYTESKGPDYRYERLPEEFIRSFGRSISIREIDAGSCNACETEINCCSNPYYDMGRFGLKIVASPRHADVFIVTGPMTENMVEATERTYDAAPFPKMVIAAGTCAISNGIFVDGDVREGGVGSVLHPDMYIIGCPPSPNRIIRSILKAFGFIEQR